MNRQQFMDELKARLRDLPDAELAKTLDYYDEIIRDRMEDGSSEEEAVAALGTPESIAREICLDQSFSRLITARVKESRTKSSSKWLWTLLVIIGFPLWFPIVLTLLIVVLTLYAVVWTVIVALYAVLVSFAAAGVACVVGGIVGFATNGLFAGLFIVGSGLALAGLVLLLVKPMFLLTKLLIHLTAKAARGIKSLFISKEERV